MLVIGPDSAEAFRSFWDQEAMPLIGLADPEHRVADLYGQRVKLLRGGRLPSVLIVDKDGCLHFRHDGGSMQDIPANSKVLAVLDSLRVIQDEAVSTNRED